MEWLDETLLDRFRFGRKCEWCGKPAYGLDPHHCFGRGMGGGSRIDLALNLIGLCWHCHRIEIPRGRILRCDLLAVIASRDGVQQDLIVAIVRELRNAHVAACDRADFIVDVHSQYGLPSPLSGRHFLQAGNRAAAPGSGEAALFDFEED